MEPFVSATSVRDPKPGLVLAAFAVVYVFWGSTYAGVLLALKWLPPFLLAGGRAIIAGTLLLLWARRSERAGSLRDWARSAVAGVLMLTLANGMITWAEQLVPSNIAALVVASSPVFMVLLDWARPGGERPASFVLIGAALGLGGVALLMGDPHGGQRPIELAGMVALIGSALFWALGALFSRYSGGGGFTLSSAARQLISGGLVLLVLSALTGEWSRWQPSQVSAVPLFAFVYLVLFGSLLGYTTYGWLLKVSTAPRVATTAFVNPAVAVILGWALLGESLSARQVLGAAVILAGVVLMTQRRIAAKIAAPLQPALTPEARLQPALATAEVPLSQRVSGAGSASRP